MSNYKKHTACPCGESSDAFAIYDEGDGPNGYCWKCHKYFPTVDGDITITKPKEAEDFKQPDPQALPCKAIEARRISQETVEKYGVKTEFDTETGQPKAWYFPYYRDGKISGWKVRLADTKFFFTIGDVRGGVQLFGQSLHTSGKMVVITEGEFDALAAYEMFKQRGKDYKVVSLPNGANAKALKPHIEWLNRFENIILCFDQDETGQAAVKKAVGLLPPGKVRTMSFSMKDANDMLLEDRTDEFIKALHSARAERPDGIISGGDTWDLVINKPKVSCYPFPWQEINNLTYGKRFGELDTWTSGSGSGKTQVFRELMYHDLVTTDYNIGIMSLEEPLTDTIEALMSIRMNQRIHLPDVREKLTDEVLKDAWLHTAGTNRIHLYDHFGSVDEDSLFSKIRYLAKGLDCRFIYLDHLSIVVSGYAAQGNERERIDSIMTELKRLTQELNIWIGLVVHLRKSDTKPFELGAIPSLDDLRGSGAIKQLSNSVFAISRDQQHPDDRIRNTSQLHVLKCRFSGQTGPAGWLYFNRNTGRMEECEAPIPQATAEEKEF